LDWWIVDQISGVGSALHCSNGVLGIGVVATHGGDRTQNNYDYQNFQQVVTGVPVHIKHIFKGVPKFPYEFSRVYTESLSPKRSNGKIVRSRDINISV